MQTQNAISSRNTHVNNISIKNLKHLINFKHDSNKMYRVKITYEVAPGRNNNHKSVYLNVQILKFS